MIVMVNTKAETNVKAYIRDRTFFEVDDNNKKQDQLATSKIKSVYSFHTGELGKYSVDDWLTLAHESDFWGVA